MVVRGSAALLQRGFSQSHVERLQEEARKRDIDISIEGGFASSSRGPGLGSEAFKAAGFSVRQIGGAGGRIVIQAPGHVKTALQQGPPPESVARLKQLQAEGKEETRQFKELEARLEGVTERGLIFPGRAPGETRAIDPFRGEAILTSVREQPLDVLGAPPEPKFRIGGEFVRAPFETKAGRARRFREKIISGGPIQISGVVSKAPFAIGRPTTIREFGLAGNVLAAGITQTQASPASIKALESKFGRIDRLDARLDKERGILEATPPPRTQAEFNAYNAKVKAFNARVQQRERALELVKESDPGLFSTFTTLGSISPGVGSVLSGRGVLPPPKPFFVAPGEIVQMFELGKPIGETAGAILGPPGELLGQSVFEQMKTGGVGTGPFLVDPVATIFGVKRQAEVRAEQKKAKAAGREPLFGFSQAEIGARGIGRTFFETGPIFFPGGVGTAAATTFALRADTPEEALGTAAIGFAVGGVVRGAKPIAALIKTAVPAGKGLAALSVAGKVSGKALFPVAGAAIAGTSLFELSLATTEKESRAASRRISAGFGAFTLGAGFGTKLVGGLVSPLEGPSGLIARRITIKEKPAKTFKELFPKETILDVSLEPMGKPFKPEFSGPLAFKPTTKKPGDMGSPELGKFLSVVKRPPKPGEVDIFGFKVPTKPKTKLEFIGPLAFKPKKGTKLFSIFEAPELGEFLSVVKRPTKPGEVDMFGNKLLPKPKTRPEFTGPLAFKPTTRKPGVVGVPELEEFLQPVKRLAKPGEVDIFGVKVPLKPKTRPEFVGPLSFKPTTRKPKVMDIPELGEFLQPVKRPLKPGEVDIFGGKILPTPKLRPEFSGPLAFKPTTQKPKLWEVPELGEFFEVVKKPGKIVEGNILGLPLPLPKTKVRKEFTGPLAFKPTTKKPQILTIEFAPPLAAKPRKPSRGGTITILKDVEKTFDVPGSLVGLSLGLRRTKPPVEILFEGEQFDLFGGGKRQTRLGAIFEKAGIKQAKDPFAAFAPSGTSFAEFKSGKLTPSQQDIIAGARIGGGPKFGEFLGRGQLLPGLKGKVEDLPGFRTRQQQRVEELSIMSDRVVQETLSGATELLQSGRRIGVGIRARGRVRPSRATRTRAIENVFEDVGFISDVGFGFGVGTGIGFGQGIGFRERLRTKEELKEIEEPILFPLLPRLAKRRRARVPSLLLPGFIPVTRKAGRVVPLIGFPVSKEAARAIGISTVLGTPRASFAILPTRKAARKVRAPRIPSGAERFFRPAKSPALAGFLVEKTKFRIDTPGEILGITKKGLAAPRKKKRKKKKRGRR